MTVKTLSMTAAASGTLVFGSAALADLIGIEAVVTTVELQDNGDPFTPGPTSMYDSIRIYAVFDDPTDRLTGVSGNTAIANALELSSGFGPFYNFAFGTIDNQIPPAVTGTPEETFDSWLEIGRTDASVGTSTGYTPGFPVLGTDITNFLVTNGGYLRTSNDPLTIAGADRRVVFAQLTIRRGFSIEGRVRLDVITTSFPSGTTINNITFDVGLNPLCATSDIAAPGGRVDADDLLAVLNDWGCAMEGPSYCRGDVNGDGQVDTDDILRIVNDWGFCSIPATDGGDRRRDRPYRPRVLRWNLATPSDRTVADDDRDQREEPPR